MSRERIKALMNGALKIVIAGGIIGWLVHTGRLDLKSIAMIFQPVFLAVGLLLIGLSLFVNSERWRFIASPDNVKASRWSVFRLTLIGTFFNFAMPGGVGGDVVKAYYFSKEHPHARATAITSVVLDRALGLYAMLFMAVVAMTVDFNHVQEIPALRTLFVFLTLLFVGLSVAFILLFSRRFHRAGVWPKVLSILPLAEKFNKLYQASYDLGHRKKRIALVILMSFVSQSLAIFFLYLVGTMAGFGIPLSVYFLVAPIGYMATAIPISPAGVGVGQAAFLFLFDAYTGQSTNVGPLVITAQQAMTVLFGLAGAALYVKNRDPKFAETERVIHP